MLDAAQSCLLAMVIMIKEYPERTLKVTTFLMITNNNSNNNLLSYGLCL